MQIIDFYLHWFVNFTFDSIKIPSKIFQKYPVRKSVAWSNKFTAN